MEVHERRILFHAHDRTDPSHTREQTCRLHRGTSPLQPLTRILDLKGNIEVNLDHLVTRYLVPRYVYLLGRQGTRVPQAVIDEFTKSLADPGVAQDPVFENNLQMPTMGTQ